MKLLYKKISQLVTCLLKFCLFVYVKLFHRRKVIKEPCDILLLHTNKKRISRSMRLVKSLESHDLIVKYDVIPPIHIIVIRRLLFISKKITNYSQSYLEAYSMYLIEKYEPNLVVTFMEGSNLSYFLKKQLNEKNKKLVNMAHAVIHDSPKQNKYDFDYFFVFGQSSVDQVLRKKAYGNPKLVKVGSFYMNFNTIVDKDIRYKNNILFISQGHDKDVDVINHNLNNLQILADWSKQTDYTIMIKFHPLEDVNIIQRRFKDSNFVFLNKNIGIEEALQECSLVILSHSNAAIEAALCRIPVVILNDSDKPSYLELDDFYLPRARNKQELDYNVRKTFDRYDEFIDVGERFIDRHIEKREDSVSYITKCMISIINGNEDFDYVVKNGELNR